MINEISTLSLAVKRLFKSLQADQATIDLAEKIQSALEKGHTAIKDQQLIENSLISSDGLNAYIVQKNNLSGFRRFYNQEMFIKNSFNNNDFKPHFSVHQISDAVKQVSTIINYQDIDSMDLQWQASISFLHSSRFILNGGPGTGKTTTVARMLLLYFILNPRAKVALAAPTGKAANRMLQSLITTIDSFESIADDLKQKLNLEAKTLHRLLGYNPKNNHLLYKSNKHLPYDLIIVDEASMLDVSLTHGLLKALRPDSQLLLIGDVNQLPAVEAGHVFADLCSQMQNQIQTNNLYQHYIKASLNSIPTSSHYIELLKNYRFEQGSAVALLCQAIKEKEFSEIQKLKQESTIKWVNPQNNTEKSHDLTTWFHSHPNNETAMILSAVNQGSNGVEQLNSLAIQILHPNKYTQMHERMPVLITQNDYTLNVFNGDIGHLTSINNKWHIAFDDFNQQRLILLSAIKNWKPAYAISIHKSQGSEYDHVLIVLPEDQELEILSNQLLYTAASRAKKSVCLWSSEKILKLAILRDEQRVTFLGSNI